MHKIVRQFNWSYNSSVVETIVKFHSEYGRIHTQSGGFEAFWYLMRGSDVYNSDD